MAASEEVSCQSQRDAEAQRCRGPSGGAVVRGGGVSICAAWVVADVWAGERPLLSHSMARRPSPGHGPWHGLRNPTSPRAASSLLSGCGAAPSCTGRVWNPLPRGVGGRAAGRRGLPGSRCSCPLLWPPQAGEVRRGRPGACVALGGWEKRGLPVRSWVGPENVSGWPGLQLPEAAPGS